MAPCPRRRVYPARHQSGEALLSLRGISTLGDRGAPALQDLSLDVHRGEVFGIAGVDGNGQKELGEVIAGQRQVTSGQVLFDGVDITNRGVAAATRIGIGYVTDDRLDEGSVAGCQHHRERRAEVDRPQAILQWFLAEPAGNGGAGAPSDRRLRCQGARSGYRDRDALGRQHPEAIAGPRAGARSEAARLQQADDRARPENRPFRAAVPAPSKPTPARPWS